MDAHPQASASTGLSLDFCTRLAKQISQMVAEDLHQRFHIQPLSPCKPRAIAQAGQTCATISPSETLTRHQVGSASTSLANSDSETATDHAWVRPNGTAIGTVDQTVREKPQHRDILTDNETYEYISGAEEDTNPRFSIGVVSSSQTLCTSRGAQHAQSNSCSSENDVPASHGERPAEQKGQKNLNHKSSTSEGPSEEPHPKCIPRGQLGPRQAQPCFLGSTGSHQNVIENPRQLQLNELENRLASSLFDSKKSKSSKGSKGSGQSGKQPTQSQKISTEAAESVNGQGFPSLGGMFSKKKPKESANLDPESDPSLREVLANVEKHAQRNGVPGSARDVSSSIHRKSEAQPQPETQLQVQPQEHGQAEPQALQQQAPPQAQAQDEQAHCDEQQHKTTQHKAGSRSSPESFQQSRPSRRHRDGRRSYTSSGGLILLPGQVMSPPEGEACSQDDAPSMSCRRHSSNSRGLRKPSLRDVQKKYSQASKSSKLSQHAVESLRRLHTEQIMHGKLEEPGESAGSLCLEVEEDGAGCISQASRRISKATLGVILYASGILPLDQMDDDGVPQDAGGLSWRRWASRIYQCFILLLLALMTASSMFSSAAASGEDRFLSRATLLSTTSMTLGAFVGQVTLVVLGGCRSLSSSHDVLTDFLRRHGCLSKWIRLSFRDTVLVFGVWLSALMLELYLSWFERDPAYRIVAFTISSLALACITVAMLYMSRGLACAVDAYSSDFFVRRPCFRRAVREWNFLQAMLRKSCSAIELCLFSLQATVTAVVLLCLVDILSTLAGDGHVALRNMLRFLPTLLLGVGVIRVTMLGAQVTEKCQRVPGFVNSLSFGLDVDYGRQYVVDYITSSAAGFYIFEVRLTSSMTFKIIYLSCVLAMSIVTKVFFSG